jgi:diguanylate cyclase (GGDEF)-like protein
VIADMAAGGVLVLGSAACLASAVRGRITALAFGIALALAAAAELADVAVLWDLASAAGLVAIGALVLDCSPAVSRLSWLDAAMGASASAAVASALGADTATTIAVAGVVGGPALNRWRPSRSVAVAALGLVALAAGPALAPLAVIGFVTAAWMRQPPCEPGPEFSPIVLSAIVVFALAALTLLTVGQFAELDDAAVALALVTVLAGIVRAGMTVVERLRESEHRAITDELTGLANRRHLMNRLRAGIAAAGEDDSQLALLLIDLDGFKELNDTLGHHAGDEVLRQIGPRLAKLLRGEDTLARLGGDEFAVVLRPADEATASTAGLRLRAALERSFDVGDIAVHIDASVGIAMYPDHSTDALGLLQRADVAMYEAKRMRTGHEVYLSSRDRHSRQRLALIGELHGALQAGQLVLHYQPKADLATRAVRGVEALVRWQHPQRGLLGPGEFLPLMEQSGLTRALTEFVLDRAIDEIGELRRRGFDLSVAANLGPADLLDLSLPSEIDRLLQRGDLRPEHLELEVSEDVVMVDVERTMDVLVGLRGTGVRTALDDFGAGHAALGHIKHLQVDTLKIDRSFVMRLVDDERDAAIVHSLVDLGHRLGVRVVAEGVESNAAWSRLASWQCDEAQGFFVCRPMPVAELAIWLARLTDRPPHFPDARLWAAVRP